MVDKAIQDQKEDEMSDKIEKAVLEEIAGKNVFEKNGMFECNICAAIFEDRNNALIHVLETELKVMPAIRLTIEKCEEQKAKEFVTLSKTADVLVEQARKEEQEVWAQQEMRLINFYKRELRKVRAKMVKEIEKIMEFCPRRAAESYYVITESELKKLKKDMGLE